MEYTLDELKEIWKDKINGFRDKDIFCLYIDNPFCIKKCKFCIYSPTETKIGSDLYKKYYTEMLPGEIEKFKEILNLRVPDSIYFGGGTASLMTEEIMEDIFSKIPNFKEIKNKVFENHPAMLTKRKIDIFAKYNFTYLSFGIQSFNKEIILEQSRILFNINKVQELIQYAKEKYT